VPTLPPFAKPASSVGWSTFDLDIVVDDSDSNSDLSALADALAGIDAVFHTAQSAPLGPQRHRPEYSLAMGDGGASRRARLAILGDLLLFALVLAGAVVMFRSALSDDSVLHCRRTEAIECRLNDGGWHELDTSRPVTVPPPGPKDYDCPIDYPTADGESLRMGEAGEDHANQAARLLNAFAVGNDPEVHLSLPYSRQAKKMDLLVGVLLVVMALLMAYGSYRRRRHSTP